jgi:hypothetical protein
MSDFEDEKTETETVVSIMEGMKFYDIWSHENFLAPFLCLCTYRNLEQVQEVFKSAYQVFDPEEILYSFNNEGIFCIELHNIYKDLKSLAEDLIVYRISGLMDQEIGESK